MLDICLEESVLLAGDPLHSSLRSLEDTATAAYASRYPPTLSGDWRCDRLTAEVAVLLDTVVV